MWQGKDECFMPPAEDAQLLLRLVQRHLLAMELNLSPRYPEEEWGFQAQQALEKLHKATIVLSNSQAPRSHDLQTLARDAGVCLTGELLQLQMFAVEARYEEGPFTLPASREHLLAELESMLAGLKNEISQV